MRSERTIAARMLRAVLAKSFIEVLLVCVVATLAAFTTFSPRLRGAIDQATPARVAGWAYDPRSPEETIDVQLFLDDRFVALRRADEPRDDLVTAGATKSPRHGFSFDLAPLGLAPGRHALRVFALRPAAGATKMLLPIPTRIDAIEIPR